MIMRSVPMIGVVMAGLLVASCSSLSSFVADTLPEWAGGLPEGTPPRPGTPGYRAYLKAISGDQPASAAEPAAAPPRPPPRRPPRLRRPRPAIAEIRSTTPFTDTCEYHATAHAQSFFPPLRRRIL